MLNGNIYWVWNQFMRTFRAFMKKTSQVFLSIHPCDLPVVVFLQRTGPSIPRLWPWGAVGWQRSCGRAIWEYSGGNQTQHSMVAQSGRARREGTDIFYIGVRDEREIQFIVTLKHFRWRSLVCKQCHCQPPRIHQLPSSLRKWSPDCQWECLAIRQYSDHHRNDQQITGAAIK